MRVMRLLNTATVTAKIGTKMTVIHANKGCTCNINHKEAPKVITVKNTSSGP